MQKLIEKTIKDGRSIGTLNLALRKLHRDKKTQDIGADLERKIGAQGFWTLVVGTGSPGPLVDLVRDFSAGFRRDFFASGAEVGREQWEKVLSRGSLFELCELLAERPELFAEATGGQRLLDAVRAMAPILSARSTWYQRNTADKLLANAKESQAKELASGSLNVVLTAIEIESLSIPDLHEAVNRLQLLWERRPDLRSALASRLWGLLPSSDQWQINPKTDMFLPSILLGIVAQPAFSDEDAQCVMQALMRCTTPMKRYKTAGVLWLLWALFACARRRKTQTPKVIGKELHSFLETAAAALETRAAEPCDRDELRARFALIGLLDLLGISVAQPTVHAAGAALAASAQSGAWWLCANQGFVSAWLVLRGIERFRPLTVGLKPHFLERLLSAAAECTDLDPAADYLNSLVQREKADLAKTGRPPYRDEVHSLRNPVERSPGTRRRK